MDNNLTNRELLRNNLNRCLVIDDDEKYYWLESINSLPNIVVEMLLKEVSSRNEIIDHYIDLALNNDKDGKYLADIKEILRKTKRVVLAAKEKDQEVDSDELLAGLDNL